MPPLLDLVALYGVPIASGLITMVVLVGPARERPVVGARVYGLIAEGADRCAVRVHVREHRAGSFEDKPLVVAVAIEGQGSAFGPPDAAAVSEVNVPLARPAAEGSLALRVTHDDAILADVRVAVQPRLAVTQVPRAGSEQAGVQLQVGVERGFLVPEHPEPLGVTVHTTEDDVPPTVVATALGADVGPFSPPSRACSGGRCRYHFVAPVTARAPAVDLDVTARRGATETVSWSGPLTVVPGRIWLDPAASDPLRLASSIPRDVAYASIYSPEGRWWGSRVAMVADDLGMTRAVVSVPALPEAPVVLVLSGEPDEPSAGSAAWPLTANVVEGATLALLGDGMPDAIATETARVRRARRPAYALIGAAGFFELIYLAWRARRSRHQLEAHLREGNRHETPAVEPPWPLAAVVLVAFALALAFAILAVLTAFG